jgi:hypothetical protein
MIQSRTLARLLTVALAAIAAAAFFAASAAAREPAPGYTQFAGCPSPEENAKLSLCTRTLITGGHFQMGNKDVPLEKTITISGGTEGLETQAAGFTYNSKGGMSPVTQVVPGGVIGLTGLTWLLEFFGVNALSLYATTELAGQVGPLFTEPVVLPIKVHLTTPSGVLGKNCYVGSNTNPITLNLITTTTSPPPPNEPITGKFAEFSADEKGIIHLDNGQFVDNSFAAPGASGCVLTLFGFIPISINGLVNTQSGLPSPAGTNETRQDFDIEVVERALVYP